VEAVVVQYLHFHVGSVVEELELIQVSWTKAAEVLELVEVVVLLRLSLETVASVVALRFHVASAVEEVEVIQYSWTRAA
jgi:arginine decarboxylase-like protein